jgi:hypothetical protein
VYAVDESALALYQVDVTTGAATLVGPLGLEPSHCGMAYDSSTATMYLSDVCSDVSCTLFGLARVDLATGAATFIGDHVLTANVQGLAYDSENDVLYGADGSGGGRLVTIDRATGAATAVGGLGIADILTSLVYDSVDDVLYGFGASNIFAINRVTGAATLLGDIEPGGVSSVAHDPATDTFYAGQDTTLYTLELAGPSITEVGQTGGASLEALEVLPVVVFADGFETGVLPGRWSAVQ